jgi:hypothetical protein
MAAGQLKSGNVLTIPELYRSTVVDHTVVWNSSFEIDVTIPIGKDGVLLPAELLLYVKQV